MSNRFMRIEVAQDDDHTVSWSWIASPIKQPVASAGDLPGKPSSLAQQIATAQAIVATWSEEIRASVQLHGEDRSDTESSDDL